MNQKERSSYDTILQILKSDATLLADSVVDNIMATQREKIKKMHPYAITAPSSEHGRWQTFYKDARGVRKNIKAPSEEALLDKLIPIYFAKTHIDNLTFHELYEEWLEYKTALCGSSNTMKRHKQRYKKYFETSVLDSMKVQSIDELLLDKECNRIVSENNLTRKEWVNAKVILNGMYDYAFRKRYIEENYMSKVVIGSIQKAVHKVLLSNLQRPKRSGDLEPSSPGGGSKTRKGYPFGYPFLVPLRARDGTRTRDPDLGKVVLHQLSHSRMCLFLNDKVQYTNINGSCQSFFEKTYFPKHIF